MSETVAVLGASPRRERYANRAQRLLAEHGHTVIPVNPAFESVEGVPTVPLEALPRGLETICVYLGEARLLPLVERIRDCAPGRVVLNPGADSPAAVRALREAGMTVQLDCTLILLNSGTFSSAP